MSGGSESSSSSSSVDSDIEECFLRSCRNGDISMVKELLERKSEGKCVLDVSCKGKSKSNLGWTPLVRKFSIRHSAPYNITVDFCFVLAPGHLFWTSKSYGNFIVSQ